MELGLQNNLVSSEVVNIINKTYLNPGLEVARNLVGSVLVPGYDVPFVGKDVLVHLLVLAEEEEPYLDGVFLLNLALLAKVVLLRQVTFFGLRAR